MNSLDTMYQELIMDHARRPHGRGLAADFDGESFQVNPTCGDRVRLRVRLDASADHAGVDGEGGRTFQPRPPGAGATGGRPVLAEVSWDGQGCSISQAAASMMKDLVEGKSLDEVAALGEAFGALMRSRGRGLPPEQADALDDAIALAGVSRYPMRVKCALLGWMALKDAVAKAVAGDASPAQIPEGI